jgi:hypothetical protein
MDPSFSGETYPGPLRPYASSINSSSKETIYPWSGAVAGLTKVTKQVGPLGILPHMDPYCDPALRHSHTSRFKDEGLDIPYSANVECMPPLFGISLFDSSLVEIPWCRRSTL